MTIKIIKAGKRPEDIEYKFTCYNCKTIFTATIEDGERVHARECDYTKVPCPLCCYICTSNESVE